MADYESRLSIEVKSDGVEKAKKSLADLTKAGSGAEKAATDLGRSSRQAAGELNRASVETSKLARETTGLAKASELASGALTSSAKALGAGLIAGASLTALARITDEYTKLSGQLKIATESQSDFNKAFSDVRRIATQSQSDLSSISTLYARLSLSLREIGISSNQVASITETVSLALKASGAGAGETASTMLQLSQAFGSGVLRGEEFNAVMESSPNLMRALAQSIGVPIGKLRELAADGQITSDVLVKAFSDEALLNNFREQAKQVQTISGAMTTLKNSLVLLGGEIDNQTGAGTAFSGVLLTIARSIESIAMAIKGDLKGSLDSLYPSLEKYRIARQKQLDDENKIAGIDRQQIIPQGLRMGQIPIPGASGSINDVNPVFAQLNKQMDELRNKNPLKDITSATQEYAQKVALVNANMLAMNITQDEGNRYLAQFKTELDRATSAQDKKNKALQKTTEEQARNSQSLIDAARSISPITKDEIASLQVKLDRTKKITEAQRDLIQSEIEAAKIRRQDASDLAYIDSMIAYQESIQGVVDGLRQSILKQQDENKVRLGLADSVEDLVTVRKEEKLEMLKSVGASDEVIAQLQKEIDLRKELSSQAKYGKVLDAEKKANDDRVKSVEDANKKILENIQRTADSIEKSLTDALLRGFESGKTFAENFRDTLVNMFKTLVLKPVINFILAPVSEAIAKGVAGSNQKGIVGTASDIFSNLKNVFTNTNNSIIGGIESIGATIANGMGGIRDSIGGFIGKNAGAISNGIAYAGAILQLSQGNWAGAAGTAIGTFFGGPVGGAIGSFIGSTIGSFLSGKPSTKKYSTGATTSFANGKLTGSSSLSGLAGYGRSLGGSDALIGLGEAYSKAIGALFKSFDLTDAVTTSMSLFQRSSKKTRAWGYFSAAFGDGGGVSFSSGDTPYASTQEALQALIAKVMTTGITGGIMASKLPQDIKNLFNGLTDQNVIANMLQSTINLGNANQALIDSFGLTATEAAKVAFQSGMAGDELAAVVNSLIQSANATRTVGDAFIEFKATLTESLGGSLFGSLNAFDAALKSIDASTTEGAASFYELFSLRDEFITFQNSIDSLKGGVKSSLLGIVSDSEKQQILQADLAELFDTLNLTLPSTIDELIALGKSIDFTTAEGINLANAFPALVNAFLATKDVIADLTKTTDDFATQFEFMRYQALGKNYGAGFANSFVPSFAVGTNYVPSDGLAMIHQGERIIPAADNQQLMQNSVNMVQAIRDLRTDVTNLNIAMQTAAVNTGKTAKSLDNIERGGVIISDIGIDGNEQILKVEVVA